MVVRRKAKERRQRTPQMRRTRFRTRRAPIVPPSSRRVRTDADIVNAFRATGPGWLTRMNDALRTYLHEHAL
ncbi:MULTISPECIES: BrnA antitoxin family protein [unclassified Burkholderia]|nr:MULTISPECIES: BrnA antitoxin family protein [Burkholderia]